MTWLTSPESTHRNPMIKKAPCTMTEISPVITSHFTDLTKMVRCPPKKNFWAATAKSRAASNSTASASQSKTIATTRVTASNAGIRRNTSTISTRRAKMPSIETQTLLSQNKNSIKMTKITIKKDAAAKKPNVLKSIASAITLTLSAQTFASVKSVKMVLKLSSAELTMIPSTSLAENSMLKPRDF